MRIDGSPLTDGQIEAVAEGDICQNVPISEHVRAERITSLLAKLWEFAEMKRSLEFNSETHVLLSYQRFFEISVQKEKRDDTGTGRHAAPACGGSPRDGKAGGRTHKSCTSKGRFP